MKNQTYKIVILGSLWGIIEMTFGYFLHSISFKVGWIFWFPLALFFVNKIYQSTKSYTSVMLLTTLAASIKLINLFFTHRPEIVINPAISMIFEALSFIIVLNFCKSSKLNFHRIFLMNSLWRALFLCFCGALPKNMFFMSPASNFTSFAEFFILKNIATTILITAGVVIANKIKIQNASKIPKIN